MVGRGKEAMSVRDDSRKPVFCTVCGRTARLEWHTIEEDIAERRECATRSGEGLWMCADVCHVTCHRLMGDDDKSGAGARAALEMLRRLAGVVEGPRRKYRRKGQR